MVEQLDFLVSVAASGAADTEATVARMARAAVESALEKDAAQQQKSIASALASLTAGTAGEDTVTPMWTAALAKAAAEVAAKPASKPFANPSLVRREGAGARGGGEGRAEGLAG